MAVRIDCVMLAAGMSSRMKKWKMALPCKDATVIECSVRNALNVCSRVILVAGHRAGELEQLFQGWKRVELILNPRYREDMFTSVKIGAAHVKTKRFFLALGDMPMVEPTVYRALLKYTYAEAVIPKYRGKKGHPLLLAQGVAKYITEFKEKGSLRDVLALFPTLTVPLETDHILCDIDNQEDYKMWVKKEN